MFKFIFSILMVLSGSQVMAQQVLASAGSELANVQAAVAFTLGEAVIETVDNGVTLANQGFHKPMQVTPVTHIHEEGPQALSDPEAIKVYPNPIRERLHIDVKDIYLGSYFQLTDASGKVVRKGILTNHQEVLSLQTLTAGAYLLSIQEPVHFNNRTFQLVKY